ncbi:MAG: DNA-binding protein [Oscillospiraceae bacterium]|nr:DNA-binding protein [Oscillospiraceae bacterium]
MKNQTYRMTMLFDFYGELLTERQREFFDLYYNEDLSLAEIAENSGISRQGVRDVIVRAEAAMQEVEDKTGLIRRYAQMQRRIAAIESAAAEIKTINYRQYEDPRVDALTDAIVQEAQALKE